MKLKHDKRKKHKVALDSSASRVSQPDNKVPWYAYSLITRYHKKIPYSMIYKELPNPLPLPCRESLLMRIECMQIPLGDTN